MTIAKKTGSVEVTEDAIQKDRGDQLKNIEEGVEVSGGPTNH